MKTSALVLALLGIGVASASLIKQNIGENIQRQQLAQVEAENMYNAIENMDMA